MTTCTFGHAENAGVWVIDLGRLGTTSPQHLNREADRLIQAFLEAFAEVCTVEYAEGDLVELGKDGETVAVWAEVPLVQRNGGQFRPEIKAEVGDPSDVAAVVNVMLRCNVLVAQPGPDEQSKVVPNGLYFHYDSGIKGEVGERAEFDNAHVTADVEVDPWVDAPLHDGRFLDNRSVAELNRPRLERALRRWEAAVGKPLSEVESVPYSSFVHRYGFRSGGQPDPA